MDMSLIKVRCKKCQSVYTVAVGYKLGAAHGPDKNCVSNQWEMVDE